MGIRGGAKEHLFNVANSGIEKVHISKYKNGRVVFDWANIAHRFLSRCNNITQFRNEFINLIHKFYKHGIELIFVFDGKPRDEKLQIIEQRKSTRDKVLDKIGNIIENVTNPEEDFQTILHLARRIKTIKYQHVIECKKLFDMLGVRYIHLEHIEADCIFKILLENGIGDACFSADMDILAFGCKRIIQDLNFKDDTVIEINYEALLTHLGVSQEQLLMAFILSGTDWNNGLKKSNFARNLELIKKYDTISGVIANLDEINRGQPVDKHIGIPNKFDWKFSLEVYSEVLGTEILSSIKDILKKQEQQTETMKNQDGFNILLEYGKSIFANDPDLKYIRKYQEYIFSKYSYKFNIISPTPYGFKQKSTPPTNRAQIQKKIKN